MDNKIEARMEWHGATLRLILTRRHFVIGLEQFVRMNAHDVDTCWRPKAHGLRGRKARKRSCLISHTLKPLSNGGRGPCTQMYMALDDGG